MKTLYGICAVLGGTVLACQFVMTILGLGSDAAGDMADDLDLDSADGAHHGAHHGSTWFFGVVTFRTIIAALTFFGLAGLAAGATQGMSASSILIVALATGLAAMYAVHMMMEGLHKLKADGTARIERCVGKQGTVYVTVPGHSRGAGKIHIALQERTMEYQAKTTQDDLPSGCKVRVVGVLDADTVEVQAVAQAQGESHV